MPSELSPLISTTARAWSSVSLTIVGAGVAIDEAGTGLPDNGGLAAATLDEAARTRRNPRKTSRLGLLQPVQ